MIFTRAVSSTVHGFDSVVHAMYCSARFAEVVSEDVENTPL